MTLDIYWISLLFLAPTCTLLASRSLLLRPLRSLLTRKAQPQSQPLPDLETCLAAARRTEARRFRRIFLQVYLLVMSAEWLQSPYLYSLLRDEKALAESTVARLYATSYAAAAVSAFFTGFFADRFGRRRACLAFCGLHSLSALSVVFSSLPVLFLGRIAAGIALTLLWTAFESWMVTEHKAREIGRASVELSGMFGIMTTSNCAAAMLGGVLGHCIVLAMRSMVIPSIAGIMIDAAGAALIVRDWNENYGGEAVAGDLQESAEQERGGWPGDVRVYLMTYISCIFEGTNFLVLYYWPGMLQDARKRNTPGGGAAMPLGIVFANFMSIMIFGAVFFSFLVKARDGRRIWTTALNLVTADTLLPFAVLLAGASLAVLSVVDSELTIFGTLLIFEFSNGVYIPCIAYKRGLIVKDSGRAATYAMMKIPLFIFAMWSINRATDGDMGRRIPSLVVGACLLVTAAAASIIMRRVPTDSSHQEFQQSSSDMKKREPTEAYEPEPEV